MSRLVEVFKELLDYTEYTSLIVFFALAGIVTTFLIFWFLRKYKQYKWAKYIPGLLLLIFGLFNLFMLDLSTEEFLKEKGMIWFITGTSVGIATLLFSLILGVISKEKKPKKSRNKKARRIEEKEVDA